MTIIPKRVVEVKRGPDIEGMQELTTVVLELEDGEILEIALPTYLFLRMRHV